MSRRDLVDRLAELTGNLVTVVDPGDGWPGLVSIRLGDGDLLAAVHLGPIGLSHRNRDDVERRFQNPGKGRPMSAPEGYLPLLLGIWEQGEHPVLVGMEAWARLGKPTRQSLFIPLWLLDRAASTGWSEHHSTSGELIIGFHPALLPAYLEARRSGLRIEPEQVADISEASGLIAEPEEGAAERARRAVTALVRRKRFGKDVVVAYEGRCAMCGLNFGLVEGAHIYPVQAPGSPDAVWNGLALCGNHHAAFDRHLLWVEPEQRSIRVHPTVLAAAGQDATARQFVEMTQPHLRLPASRRDEPRADMFARRYDFYGPDYKWARRRARSR
jgi:HNH endonuclease